MLVTDRDALECDMAETYHIYDLYALPARKIAMLACGLRETSRIKIKMSGINISLDLALLAGIADSANLLVWMQSKDAADGINKPKSILGVLLEDDKKGLSYESPEEFEKAWKDLGGGAHA